MNNCVKKTLCAFALINLLSVGVNCISAMNNKKSIIKINYKKDINDQEIDCIEASPFQPCANQLNATMFSDAWIKEITTEEQSTHLIISFRDTLSNDISKATLKKRKTTIAAVKCAMEKKRGEKKCIVTLSTDKTTRIWDTCTGDCIITLNGDKTQIRFTYDGKYLAAGNIGETQLYDRKGTLLTTFNDHPYFVYSATKSPNGKFFAIGSNKKIILSAAGKKNETRTLHCDQSVYSITFNHNNQFMAAGLNDGSVEIYCMKSGKLFSSLKGHKDTVFSIFFTKDNTVITVSIDSTIKIWDIEGNCLQTLWNKNTGGFMTGALSQDEKLLVTGTGGSRKNPGIDFWDLTNNAHLAKIGDYNGRIQSIEFSDDEKTIITKSDNKKTGTGESRTLRIIDHDNYTKPVTIDCEDYENKLKLIESDFTINFNKN